jgi:hypothetical protein
MDYQITVRMERRWGPKDRFKVLSKRTSTVLHLDDTDEDHEAFWVLFKDLGDRAAAFKTAKGQALVDAIKARLDEKS